NERKPYMNRADLEYLDRGMQEFIKVDDYLSQFLVPKMVEHAADRAYFLYEARKASNLAHKSGNYDYWENQKIQWTQKAEFAEQIWADRRKDVNAVGKKRVFSATTAAERIPV